MLDNTQKSFCIKCLKEVSSEVQQCECGGTYFAFGKLKIEDGKILCQCGSEKFKTGMHMDYANKATTTLICTKCNNVCGTENYRNKESMAYWEDYDGEDDEEDYDYDEDDD